MKIKRAILRKVLNILGVATIGLITACTKYGAEIATFHMNLKGNVVSKDSLNAIENIKVRGLNTFSGSSTLTDGEGKFSINVEIEERTHRAGLNISDIDGSLHGSFMAKDTILDLSSEEIKSRTKSGIEIQLKRDE